MLTVLQIAYPLAPVGPDAVGGAEQILTRIDEALVAAGHRSIVVAASGSRCRGRLVPVGAAPALLDEPAVAAAEARTRAAIERVLAAERVDLVHYHGIDFHRYLVPSARSLVTLHLPLDWYPPRALAAGVRYVCVSEAQRRVVGIDAAVIDNGVPLLPWRPRVRKRAFALTFGRICPEKGFHVAIEAARRAGVPIVVGGRLFPYPAHMDYWRQDVAPRLVHDAVFCGPLAGARKRRLLEAARCLVVASLAAETSSLVAMEALAAGTPVVALRAGALPEIVEHGRTGFIARDLDELAAAIARAPTIDAHACRAAAEERFAAARMTERYLQHYRALVPTEAAA